MSWLIRLFDRRATLIRLILLDVTGVNYLLFGHGAVLKPTATQWGLAIAAFAAVLVLRSHLLVSLIVQAGLLEVSFVLLDDATISQVGTAWILLELAMAARDLRAVWFSTGLVVAVYLVNLIGDPWPQARSTIFGLVVTVGVPVLLGLVIRTMRELAEQASQKAVSENRAARAEERATIARELHDVVAHHVASMVLRVGVARHVLADLDPRVGEVFDDVHKTGTNALADLRQLVALLREPGPEDDAAQGSIVPGDLTAALAAAVENAERAGVTVATEIDPSIANLDAMRRLAVLRLTQETLTNVAKHAGPGAHATVRVTMVGEELAWEVIDDGGSGKSAPVPSGGHGLPGMRERAGLMGGTLDAGPEPGGGWRVATRLPS
jgi:signal transduction histidine kinase